MNLTIMARSGVSYTLIEIKGLWLDASLSDWSCWYELLGDRFYWYNSWLWGPQQLAIGFPAVQSLPKLEFLVPAQFVLTLCDLQFFK